MDAIEVIEMEHLQERVAELEASLAVARIVNQELKRYIAELEAQLAARTATPSAHKLPPGFQKAKELAMRTGKSVRVITTN